MAGEVKPTDDSRCPERDALLQLKELRVSSSPRAMDDDSHSSSKSTERFDIISVRKYQSFGDGFVGFQDWVELYKSCRGRTIQ